MDYKMVYINKMADIMDEVVGYEKRYEVLDGCESLSSKDSKIKRAHKMIGVMGKMEGILSSEELIEVRQRCACKPSKFLKKIREIRKISSSEAVRLDMLERTGYAGNIEKIDLNSFKVAFKTQKCFCGMVGKSKEKVPLTWCHCCSGHIKWLYESTLEKELDIELVSSVVSGGEDCVFVIRKK